MARNLLSLCSLFLLLACSQVDVVEHEKLRPMLQPELFFDGHLTAHGVVKNRKGNVIRTFDADIEASWQNGVGTLVEDFLFNDGFAQQRVWTLTPDGSGSYVGTAGDVVGKANLKSAGNSLFLNYVLQVPYGDGTVNVRVDDRMYLVSPGVIVNESRMSKFGWPVGSILLVIIRHEDPAN